MSAAPGTDAEEDVFARLTDPAGLTGTHADRRRASYGGGGGHA